MSSVFIIRLTDSLTIPDGDKSHRYTINDTSRATSYRPVVDALI
ncbi:MAG TPA: hypothetical protein PLF13_02565 [candidate division Zixibacteria bacterium]|nr:hypothetical protein [candidate division Zixibacteria bacterium]